jgi:O-methyltransferase
MYLDLALFLLRNPSSESLRVARLITALKPRFTMVRSANLINLHRTVTHVNNLGIEGDIVECGVWNGGSAALMWAAQHQSQQRVNRKMWLFDSFQGVPPPSDDDGASAKESYFEGFCKGDPKNVAAAFDRLNLPLADVQIVPGWFEDTLHTVNIESVAVLHIDADWYDPILFVLRTFYDRVTPGGYILLDDYSFWTGSNKALADFLNERGLTDLVEIHPVASMGAFFRKPIAQPVFATE